ncbi:MAG: hypothetical protein IPH39_19065 [Sulfuritalea sp.]|nr:hypothetical protein [Sulfuritalea sp.]
MGGRVVVRSLRQLRQFLCAFLRANRWLKPGSLARQRETRLASSARIKVEIGNIRLRKEAPNVLITEFVQTYRSDAYRDTTRKALQWVKVGGEWLIDREITRQRRGSSARRVKVD